MVERQGRDDRRLVRRHDREHGRRARRRRARAWPRSSRRRRSAAGTATPTRTASGTSGNSEVPTDEGFDTPLAFDFGLTRTPPTHPDAAAPTLPDRVSPCDGARAHRARLRPHARLRRLLARARLPQGRARSSASRRSSRTAGRTTTSSSPRAPTCSRRSALERAVQEALRLPGRARHAGPRGVRDAARAVLRADAEGRAATASRASPRCGPRAAPTPRRREAAHRDGVAAARHADAAVAARDATRRARSPTAATHDRGGRARRTRRAESAWLYYATAPLTRDARLAGSGGRSTSW